MKVHKEHGGALAAELSQRGAKIIEQAGVLWRARHDGSDSPCNDWALTRAELAARDILKAIEKYREATNPSLCGGTLPAARFDEIQGKGEEAA